MELKIYDKQGIVKMTVSPDNSSQWNHEVGVENVVTVNFTTWEFLVLEVGWYILVEGQRFSIKSEYRPKHIHDTKYTYNLKFYGREHDTQDILFCRLNQGEDDLESVFAYDGTPMEFLNKVVANMNRNSDGVVWKAGETITANRQTINFNGLYCWDALGEIARTFGTEWWMDGEYVNLSKCIRGESVSLGYGQGLKSGLTQNENTNAVKWFTRLIPVGSSKNIDKSKYGYATLQLPGREKYIDINTQYGLKEYREEAAFSEIYPHRVGTISSVRSEARINENLDEYTVYYVKDTSLPFNPDDYMLPGEVIHMTFNTGALAGKEFEVNWNNGTLEFEIINQYPDEDTQWPGGNLIPSGGDLYVLSNISMPDEYNTAAEKEYQEAVDAYLEEYSLDISIYTGNTDYIYVAKNNVPLSLGQRVRLVSEIYFGSNGRDSRITRVSRKLNNLGEATIECGNTISASWTQKISSNINNVAVTQKSDQQKINKTEKDITSLSGLWELKETDSGEKYLFTPYNILTLLGLTSYSTGKAQKFPSIYDGLPIDNQTLKWVEVTEQVGTDEEGNPIYETAKVLKAAGGGTGDGVADSVHWDNIDGKPDFSQYVTNDSLLKYLPLSGGTMTGKITLPVGIGTPSLDWGENGSLGGIWVSSTGIFQIIAESDFRVLTNVDGVSTRQFGISNAGNMGVTGTLLVGKGGYLTNSQFKFYVYDGDAFIDGMLAVDGNVNPNIPSMYNIGDSSKRFACVYADSVDVGGVKISLLQDGVLLVDGNLAVTGGITSYVDGGNLDLPSIYDGLPIDGDTLYWVLDDNGNKVMLKSKGDNNEGGGVANSVNWDNIEGKPSWIGESKPSYSYSEISGTPNLNEYVTSDKLNDYLPLSGGTMTGTLSFNVNGKSYKCLTEENVNPSSSSSVSPKIYTPKEIGDNGQILVVKNQSMGWRNASEIKAGGLTVTDKTAWGQTYWTSSGLPATIEGNMTNVGSITPKTNAVSDIGSTGKYFRDMYVQRVKVNGGVLSYNATQNYFELDGNLLVTGGITAFADSGAGNQWILDASALSGVTSTNQYKVYSANVTTMLAKKVTSLETKLSAIKTAFNSLSSSSSASAIGSALKDLASNL